MTSSNGFPAPGEPLPAPGKRSDLSSADARLALLTLTIAACVFRTLGFDTIEAPFIYIDELTHVELARSFWHGEGARWDGMPTHYPSWLYPLLLAPLIGGLDWSVGYPLARMLGILMTSLIALPVYGLAREVTTRRRALLAVALVLAAPALGYSATLMTENVLYPLAALALWLAFRAAMRPSFGRQALAGLALGLAFHAKAQGALLALCVGLAISIYELRHCLARPRAPLATSRGILAQLPMLLVWGTMIALRPLAVHFIDREPINPTTLFGWYYAVAKGLHEVAPRVILFSFLGYIAVFAVSCLLMPAAVGARVCARAARGRESAPVALLAAFAAVTALVFLFVSARHTVRGDDTWRAYERYFFPAVVPTIVLFCARLEMLPRRDPAGFAVRVALLALLLGGGLAVSRSSAWNVINDNPTMTIVFPMSIAQMRDATWLAVFAVLTAAVGAILLARPAGRVFWVGIGVFLAVGNVGFYRTVEMTDDLFNRESRRIAREIDTLLGRDDYLYTVTDGLDAPLIWRALTVADGQAVSLRDNSMWFGWPIAPEPDGTLRLRKTTKGTTWMLADRDLEFDLPSVKRYKHVKLYRLEPHRHPRLKSWNSE